MERGPRVVRMMSATAWRGDEGGEACPLRRRCRRRARLRRRDVAVLRLLAGVALRVLVCRGEVSSAQAARRGGGGTARRLLARTQNHDWLLPSPGAHHGCSEREAMRANRSMLDAAVCGLLCDSESYSFCHSNGASCHAWRGWVLIGGRVVRLCGPRQARARILLGMEATQLTQSGSLLPRAGTERC